MVENIEYDWDSIMLIMKGFARVENITDIIIIGDGVGEGQGVRRIKLTGVNEDD